MPCPSGKRPRAAIIAPTAAKGGSKSAQSRWAMAHADVYSGDATRRPTARATKPTRSRVVDASIHLCYFHAMKSHISATLDKKLLEDLKRFGQQECRSRSQIIEMALEEFLRKQGVADEPIVTSEARFEGIFSREETYAR